MRRCHEERDFVHEHDIASQSDGAVQLHDTQGDISETVGDMRDSSAHGFTFERADVSTEDV